MSKGHGRGFRPIRAAAGRWPTKSRRGHAGSGAPVRGRLQHCAANLPAWEVGPSAASWTRRCSCRKGHGVTGAGLLRRFDRG